MVSKIMWLILSPLLALIIGIFFLGLSRKIMARIHWRYGPPLYQPVIDIIKLFSQQGFSHGLMFDLGIIISLAGSFIVVLFLPFGNICPLQSSGGLLVILYLMLLAPLGIALSGGEAANPNISIGISRKLILSLAYEVPFLLIILASMTYYNTISIVKIVEIQQNNGWALSSLPLLLSGISYFLIFPAIVGMRPFDIVLAPQEISSGLNVEYGSKYLGIVTIENGLNLFIGSALFVNLFLGGASNPGIFFLKILGVFIVCLFVNAVFPRLRTEQTIKYLWGVPTIFAFSGLIISFILK